MIRKLNQKEIEILSFPDTNVQSFILDTVNKSFVAECSSGFVDFPDGGQNLIEVTVQIENFSACEIFEFSNRKLNVIQEFNSNNSLKDICEFSINSGTIILKGFSRNSLWTEFHFLDGSLSVTSIIE